VTPHPIVEPDCSPARPRELPSAGRRRPSLLTRRGEYLTVALLLAVALLPFRSAYAHGALQRAVPAQNARVATIPRELRLTFTEPVILAVAALELVGPGNRPVSLGPLSLARDSSQVLVAPVTGALEAGTYTVNWRIAGADGHPVRGSYRFTITPETIAAARAAADSAASAIQPVPPQAPPATHHDTTTFPDGAGAFNAESPLYAVIRWFSYMALLGMIGAVAFRYAVLGLMRRGLGDVDDSVSVPASQRAASLGALCAGLLLAASLLRLIAQSIAMFGARDAADAGSLATLIGGTAWGRGWLLQLVGALVAAVGFARARRLGGHWRLAAMGALLGAISPALSGHAVASPRWPALAIAADTLHVIGAAGWLGSLAVLLFAGVPAALRLEENRRGPAVAALVNAFSPTALAFASLVGLTGLFAGWLHLGSVSALWESGYGRTLLLKLAVLSIVALTGAYNWLRVRPALGDETGTARLRRSAGIEVAVAVIVVAITAVLVATPPPAAGMEHGASHEAAAAVLPTR
jgi:copper transport protein